MGFTSDAVEQLCRAAAARAPAFSRSSTRMSASWPVHAAHRSINSSVDIAPPGKASRGLLKTPPLRQQAGGWACAGTGRCNARFSESIGPDACPLLNEGGAFDTRGHPFFEPLGRNGRACVSCHQPADGMGLSLRSIRQRWQETVARTRCSPLSTVPTARACHRRIRSLTRCCSNRGCSASS